MPRPALIALLALSLAVLLGVPAVLLAGPSQPETLGQTQVAESASGTEAGGEADLSHQDGASTPPARVAEGDAPRTADDASDGADAAETDDDASDEPQPATPAAVQVEALGLDADVTPTGVREDGAMGIPDDVGTAGWFAPGVAPGAASGSAVLAAHVDNREQGLGQFAALHEAEPGQEVVVTDRDGQAWRYEITGRTQQPKEALDTDAVFRQRGDHVLTLITCGGAWDEAQGRYADNVIVEAAPAW